MTSWRGEWKRIDLSVMKDGFLKIIYVYFGWGFTGYESRSQRFDIIVKELETRGSFVYIVGLADRYDSWRDKLLGRVRGERNIINLTSPRILRALDFVLNKIAFLDGLGFALMFMVVARKIRPDVIIIQDEPVGFDFWFLLCNRFLLRKRIVVDYQDLTARLVAFGKRVHLGTRIGMHINEILIPKMARKLIVITKFAQTFFFSRIGRKEIFVVRELVDPKLFEVNVEEQVRFLRRKLAFEENDKIILWIGYIEGRAIPALVDLVKACGISQTRPKLLIVGPGDGRTILSLKNLAYTEEVAITFYGYVQPLSKMHVALLKLASVGFFSLPNEIFAHFVAGSKLAEYLAAGLPVIAPKLGGPSEVVKGNGLLYTPGNPEELALVIDSIFSMNLGELGKKSKQIAQEMLSPESFRKQIPDFIAFLTK